MFAAVNPISRAAGECVAGAAFLLEVLVLKLSGWSRAFVCCCLGVVAAACGGSDGVVPQLPTAPVGPVGARPDADIVMESSQGLAPAGFQMVSRVDPRAGEDGVIRAGAPVTVTFDLCGSTVNDGGHPWFLFDFDFNHVADVIGKTESCRQTHTYRIAPDAPADRSLGANFCFTNADPSGDGKCTYFSCRSVRIALPHFAGAPAGCYTSATFSFQWPGGVGPHDFFVNDDRHCQTQEDKEAIPVVIALTEADARRLCGGPGIAGSDIRFGGGTSFGCIDPRTM